MAALGLIPSEDLFPPLNGITSALVDTEPRSCSLKSLQQQPSLNDLHTIAADIKDTLSAAIAELCIDVRAINLRMQEVEKTTAQQCSVIHQVNCKVDFTLETSIVRWRIWKTEAEAII